jgi:hypothetical protein
MAKGKLLLVVCICIGTGIFCTSTKEKKSHKVVEDVTGYTTLKNGEELKKKIHDFEELQQKREKELEEIK